MNALRKMKKNAKALSPVVASIILIAVTVAVSIAVAAWMGALTVGFMQTEQVKITNVAFTGTAPSQNVVVSLQNTGSSSVTISTVYFANNVTGTVTWGGDATAGTLAAGKAGTATFAQAWTAGNQYMIKVVTSQGNVFTYSAIAPY